MKMYRLLVTVLCWSIGFPLFGADYYVSKTGLDENPGTHPDHAFLTIQHGLNALKAGDSLTIGPGEYEEFVSRKGLGQVGVETVIRAAIPGTVLLRGDVDAPTFAAVPEYPRTYVAEFDRPVQSVNEVDTLTLLIPSPNVEELQFRPGSYYYDATQNKLYISTSDMSSPDAHVYTISIRAENGFFLESAEGVTIEGIAATGFNSSREVSYSPGAYALWGILLYDSSNCVIRDCVAYLNGGGIAVNSRSPGSQNNTIEDCTAYGNYSPFAGSGGNILFYSPKNGVIRRCLAYRSPQFGVRLYGQGMEGTNRIEDSLAWGNLVDLFIKGGGTLGTAARSVAVGSGSLKQVENVLVGDKNVYLTESEWPDDSIHLEGIKVDQQDEFADPDNLDYRLQETSRFRGTGPNGTDPGPFPFEPTVFFIKPDGNDQANGLSVGAAWKTLNHAIRQIGPGDTLYCEPGSYPGDVLLDVRGDKTVSIRGRGQGEVRFEGAIQIKDAANLELQRIGFTQPVVVNGGSGLQFSNCRFTGSPDNLTLLNTTGVRLEHCAFSQFKEAGVRLSKARDVYLSSNLFDNRNGVALALSESAQSWSGFIEKIKALFTEKAKLDQSIAYSDYNAFVDLDSAVSQEGLPLPWSAWQEQHHDLHSTFTSSSRPSSIAIAALGKPVGPHALKSSETLVMTQPTVHSVSATTANLEWLISGELICDLAWGETPACEHSAEMEIDRYGSFSLTGLKPATTYYFQIRGLRHPWTQGRPPTPATVADPKFDVISFTTAAKPADPKTYYVAPDGKDENDGLSRARAWRTVSHAASQVNVGDTVWIGEGVYAERIRVRATGEKDLPISFQSLPGERVEFSSGEKLLESSWVINGKSHINIDGIYFSQFRLVGGGAGSPRVFFLNESSDISISRCFYDARGPGYGPGFLTIIGGRNVTLSNCVMISGFNSIGVAGCPGFRMEHCVVVVPMIQATTISAQDPVVLDSNIFTDNSAGKAKVWFQEWGGQDTILDKNNAYFLRLPDDQKKHYWVLNFKEGGKNLGHVRMGLEEYQRRVQKTDSLIADPQFAGLLDQELPKSGFAADGFLKSGETWDFPDFYPTNPELLSRRIGLEPEKFKDSHFQTDR